MCLIFLYLIVKDKEKLSNLDEENSKEMSNALLLIVFGINLKGSELELLGQF